MFISGRVWWCVSVWGRGKGGEGRGWACPSLYTRGCLARMLHGPRALLTAHAHPRRVQGSNPRLSPLRPRRRSVRPGARDRTTSVASPLAGGGSVTDYAPQLVNVHKPRKFERHLKTLQQLTEPMCTPSLAKLRKM